MQFHCLCQEIGGIDSVMCLLMSWTRGSQAVFGVVVEDDVVRANLNVTTRCLKRQRLHLRCFEDALTTSSKFVSAMGRLDTIRLEDTENGCLGILGRSYSFYIGLSDQQLFWENVTQKLG